MQRFIYTRVTLPLLLLLALNAFTKERTASDSTKMSALDSMWNKGMALLDSGRLSEGLRLTDSVAGYLENDSIRTVLYIQKIFQSFVRSGNVTDSVMHLKGFGTFDDTLNLSTFNCRISSSNGKKDVLPNFTFNFIFPVDKPFHLIFKGLKYTEPPRLQMGESEIDDLLSDDLVNQSLFRQDSISCTVFIDANQQIISLYDYIGAFAHGVYDSISMKKDLKKYQALSLRGYSHAWSSEHGRFTAIVAFDKPLADRRGKKGAIEPLYVRYTIIVKSNVMVCDYAEIKLQKILKIF